MRALVVVEHFVQGGEVEVGLTSIIRCIGVGHRFVFLHGDLEVLEELDALVEPPDRVGRQALVPDDIPHLVPTTTN